MTSDEALIERLRGGDLRAFDALYERYERRLFGFILRHLHDRQEAEDVLHDAFVTVLRQSERAGDSYGFRAWLFTVARNLCLNKLRSRRRASRALATLADEPPPSSPGPARLLETREAADALRRAVADLPLPLGELYDLRASGLSYEEAASVLAVPLGTVKSRMHQMVRLLRKELAR